MQAGQLVFLTRLNRAKHPNEEQNENQNQGSGAQKELEPELGAIPLRGEDHRNRDILWQTESGDGRDVEGRGRGRGSDTRRRSSPHRLALEGLKRASGMLHHVHLYRIAQCLVPPDPSYSMRWVAA